MKTILVTGGCGFIFSNFIRYMLDHYPDYKIINLDALTYAGRLENTESFKNNPNYTFVKGNICDEALVEKTFKDYEIEWVVNAAAETHVDRSITGPQDFLQTNIFGTHVLLEAARRHKVKMFLQVGTDEEYGSIKSGHFKESDPISPSSPYSCSKAAASLLALSYFKTFSLPVLVVRSTNNFGPYQFPEKFIPLFVTNLLQDRPVPLYGYGLNRRDWIHVQDNCRAVALVLHQGEPGQIYNIGAPSNEVSNIEMSLMILKKLGKPTSFLQFVKDRPGHDFRYAVNVDKITVLGFSPEYDLVTGLEKTIDWYRDNDWWWKKIKDEDFEKYYQRQYGEQKIEQKAEGSELPLELEDKISLDEVPWGEEFIKDKDEPVGQMTSLGDVIASENLILPVSSDDQAGQGEPVLSEEVGPDLSDEGGPALPRSEGDLADEFSLSEQPEEIELQDFSSEQESAASEKSAELSVKDIPIEQKSEPAARQGDESRPGDFGQEPERQFPEPIDLSNVL